MQGIIKGSGESQVIEFSGTLEIIAGQVGVAAGAGAVTPNTQRMTLASDDPAVASLALIAASASVMDDWDEADRAKVNLIVGQAGISAGAGSVGANTPRFTHASDDPAVTSLQLIDDVVGALGATAPTKAVLLGALQGGNTVGLTCTASGGLILGTITPGTAANNLGKAIDGAVGSTDTGVGALVRRKDALSALTPADGDYTLLQVDSQGALWVRQSSTQAVSYQKTNITTATTTTVKSGAGIFHGLMINKAVAAGTITIYDNTAASGTIIGTITFGAALLGDPPIPAFYDVNVSTGITIVTSAAFDITAMYN